MTNQEAIARIRDHKIAHKMDEPRAIYISEALDKAIKALEQKPMYYPPCINCHKKMDEIRRAYDKLKEQEPCEDTISRQIISDYVESHIQEINTGYGDLNEHTNRILRMIMEYIDKLPPVTPKQKIGRWIKSRDSYGNNHFTCPFCEHDIATKSADTWEDNYCSNCGAKMQEVEE